MNAGPARIRLTRPGPAAEGEEVMATNKFQVQLDYDNVCDYFSMGELKALAARLGIGEGRVAPHGPKVGAFLEWLNARNAESADTEYVCTPGEAASILEFVAGVRPDFRSPSTRPAMTNPVTTTGRRHSGPSPRSHPATRPALRPTDPDLGSLVTAWPTLLEPIRAGILAMVRAARG
jgi:hypothetical protein